MVTVAPGENWLPTRLTGVPPVAGPDVPEAYATPKGVEVVAACALPPDSGPRVARTASIAAPLATREERDVRGEGFSLIGISPFSCRQELFDFSGGGIVPM